MARAIQTRGRVDISKIIKEEKEEEEKEGGGVGGVITQTAPSAPSGAAAAGGGAAGGAGAAASGMKVKAIKEDDNIFGGPGSVDKALDQIANNATLSNIFSDENLKNIYSKILTATSQSGGGMGMLTREGLGNILTYIKGNVSVPEDVDQEYIKGLVQELSKGYHNTFGDVGEKDVMLNPFLLSIEDIKTIEGN